MWSSASNVNGQNVLVIPASGTADAAHPYFAIAVYAASAMTFSIIVSTAEAVPVRA
jgi:hypothetical protein